MKIRSILVGAGILLGLLAIGCNKDNQPHKTASIVGDWREYYAIERLFKNGTLEKEHCSLSPDKHTYSFSSDLRLHIDFDFVTPDPSTNPSDFTCDYHITPDTLTLIENGSGIAMNYPYKIEGDTLRWLKVYGYNFISGNDAYSQQREVIYYRLH